MTTNWKAGMIMNRILTFIALTLVVGIMLCTLSVAFAEVTFTEAEKNLLIQYKLGQITAGHPDYFTCLSLVFKLEQGYPDKNYPDWYVNAGQSTPGGNVTPTPAPSNNNTNNNSTTNNYNSLVKTPELGDNSASMTVLLSVAALALSGLLIARRKQHVL